MWSIKYKKKQLSNGIVYVSWFITFDFIFHDFYVYFLIFILWTILFVVLRPRFVECLFAVGCLNAHYVCSAFDQFIEDISSELQITERDHPYRVAIASSMEKEWWPNSSCRQPPPFNRREVKYNLCLMGN